MARLFLAIVALLLLLLLHGVDPTFAQEPPTVSNTKPIVFIWAQDTERPQRIKPLGSGFLLNKDGYVLTAEHVTKGYVQGERLVVSISSKSGPRVAVDMEDIACAAGAPDICFVRIPPDQVRENSISEFYNLGCRIPKLDEELRAVGFYGGSETFAGIVQPTGKVMGDPATQLLVPTTIAMQEGMSGGPVFDADGTVIGIVKGANNQNPTQTFMTPLQRVRSELTNRGVSCSTPVNIQCRGGFMIENDMELFKNNSHFCEIAVKHAWDNLVPKVDMATNFARKELRQSEQNSLQFAITTVKTNHSETRFKRDAEAFGVEWDVAVGAFARLCFLTTVPCNEDTKSILEQCSNDQH